MMQKRLLLLAYANDSGVVTAAWVAEQLGLPTSLYESVNILQNKEFSGVQS